MYITLLYSAPVVPHPHFLIMAMIGMVSALLLLIGFMLIYLVKKNKQEKLFEQWRADHNDVIHNAIFWEPGEAGNAIPIPDATLKSLETPTFRQVLIHELLMGKKAISGSASDNLIQLYNQLHLEVDSRRKLASRKWHIQAQGIQELASMEQRQFVSRIYRLTNAKNEVVRMEAQSALVQLYGFAGLRFLDVTDRPLSEWHQIQLLRLLSRMPGSPPDKVRKWLDSPNETVRLFSLKLIAEHHQQECCPEVERSLSDKSSWVRLQAIRCLREIYTPETPALLAQIYTTQDLHARLAILDTLGHIGGEEDIPFIEKQLREDVNKARLEAARALVRIGPAGKASLDRFPLATDYPFNEIIQQAKTEKTI